MQHPRLHTTREGGTAGTSSGLWHRKRSSVNHRFVLMVMGILCLIQVPMLLIALGTSLSAASDSGTYAIGVTVPIVVVVGSLLYYFGRHSSHYVSGRREGLLTVTIGWIVVALIGMCPFYIGRYIDTVYDAFFEAIGCITTTGASVFTDVEALPPSILLWRSLLQWQGGVGIVVFTVAILPLAGESAGMIFNSETTGVVHDRFVPRIAKMAKWIITIYVSLTLLCIVLLWVGPMSFFDAVCHGLACISTGGLSTKNTSIAYFGSSYVNWVIALFLLLGATSFKLLYLATVGGQPRKLLEDRELRCFVLLILLFALAGSVWLYLSGHIDSWREAMERSAFTMVSIFSSGSFFNGDYSSWGSFYGILVLLAMFVSGCSGSTAGGLKVIRFEVLFVSLNNEIRRRTHPGAVLPCRLGHSVYGQQSVYQVMIFFFTYLSLILFATFCICWEGYSFTDALSASISCASNSGAGLGFFGPLYGFQSLGVANKLLLSILMVMGRLEIFTVLSLFHRSFWRS